MRIGSEPWWMKVYVSAESDARLRRHDLRYKNAILQDRFTLRKNVRLIRIDIIVMASSYSGLWVIRSQFSPNTLIQTN